MLTKNLTRFSFGTKLCSRKPPQPEMTLVVRAAFALRPGAPLTPLEDQGALTADVFREDDEEKSGECLYASDFADFKLRADVLLKGTCHVPGGRPVTECPVRFSVGGWSKTLRVVGPRVWSDDLGGAAMSKPLSFTRMSLGYTQGFGGAGYARNPAGKGYKTRELPCVEHPREFIRARTDTPDPAGFGPINPAWPERGGKLGRDYGAAYRKKRAPYYAEDFDWSYFNAAPADQQLDGYLRGDEEIAFVNLHPDAPSFTARLPGLRLRAFVNDAQQRLCEVFMSLDTLHADLDKGVLKLTWRGVTPVKEDDFADVKTVLIASEPLGERPLPEEHYRVIVAAFEEDPTGIKAALPEEFEGAQEVLERAKNEELQAAEDVTGLDPISALLKRKLGRFREADQERIQRAVAALKAKAGPKVDLDAEIGKVLQGGDEVAPPAVPIKPGVLPDVRLRDRVRQVQATVEKLKKSLTEREMPDKDRARILKEIEPLERLAENPDLKRLDPGYTPPGPISTDEPGPGRDLSGQDLSRRDLRGMDLCGANMEGTVLTGADLRGARLAGARLRRAVLYKADLSDADLSGADLTQAHLGKARAKNANFTEANLEIAFFEEADLTGATLARATGGYVVFTRARLTGVKAAGARLDRSDFSEGNLERADLSGASLAACELEQCRAAAIDLSDAVIRGARFEGADLTGATLVRARGRRSFWFKATIDGADFTLASLERAHFTEASAAGARFFGANLRECRFYRAVLERAEIVRANLFGADLAKARLGGARFTDSNLYEARFHGASGAGCDFTGANLKRSTLEHA
jgi:uncharacterized protein YjbI with pentapeptide repeats